MANEDFLMDEEEIPENWVPQDATPSAPAVSNRILKPKFFSGSLPPNLQHDSSFVGTEPPSYIPKNALMPFGNQSNPFTNAAAASTAKIVATQIVNAIPPSKPGLPTALSSVSITSGSIANLASTTGTVGMAKAFTLFFVNSTANLACRVQLYSTAAGRDTSPEPTRPVSVPPTPGLANQIICDYVLTGLPGVPFNFPCDPVVPGGNQDAGQTTTIYFRLTNLSGGTATINVTLLFLQQEQ